MIMTLILIVALYWVALSLYAYVNLKKIFKRYKNTLRLETPLKYNAFLRLDFGKWNEEVILRRAFTMFPLKFTGSYGFLIMYAIIATLQKYLKFPKSWIEFYVKHWGGFVNRQVYGVK